MMWKFFQSRAVLCMVGFILAWAANTASAAEEKKTAAPPAEEKKAATPPAEEKKTSKSATPEKTPPAPEKKTASPAINERAAAEAAAAVRPRPKPAPRAAPPKLADKPAETAPAVAPVAHAPHWSYEGENGPHAWARLSPEFAKCGAGERQSPIDIREGMKLDLEPITFDYRVSSFKVIDNGHTIQANVGGWNAMRVMGRRFRLVQFHFHKPSEELIEGRQFEMVVHLVHKDSEGRLAVIAVLIEGGVAQPAIQTVLNNLPLEKGEEIAAATQLDPAQMLPESKKYFTYMGSLTTPPCSEDVLWIVMKQPLQASANQLGLFERLYPMNARPVQATRERVIKESN